MYPSTSSYRSCGAASRKRILRRNEVESTGNRKAVRDTDVRTRLSSHGSSSGKPSSVSSVCSTNDRRRKEKPSQSEAPMAVFLRSLFLRCFTTRKKRRKRARAMRKINKDTNHRSRDDSYAHIPTNAHEMFFQLHSKSRRSLNGNSPVSSSNDGNPSANRSPDRQFSRNGEARSATSSDTRSASRDFTPPVVVIDRRSEIEPYFLS